MSDNWQIKAWFESDEDIAQLSGAVIEAVRAALESVPGVTKVVGPFTVTVEDRDPTPAEIARAQELQVERFGALLPDPKFAVGQEITTYGQRKPMGTVARVHLENRSDELQITYSYKVLFKDGSSGIFSEDLLRKPDDS